MTGFLTLLSDYRSPTLCLLLIIRGPPQSARAWSGFPRRSCAPPVGRFRKSLFLLQVLANIHYFALWIHHIIHPNLNFCSTSLLIFTFSLSCKSIAFRNSFKNHAKRKSRIVKTTRISIKIDQPGPQHSPPEITFSASCIH